MNGPWVRLLLLLALVAAVVAPAATGPGDLPGEAIEQVRARQAEYRSLSDRVWSLAEPALKEFESARLLAGELRDHGFDVEMGVAGMPTAFVAVRGQGSPRIGFLVEYDALPGLSQVASSQREPVEDGGVGHGCGHNLLGVASVAAAEAAAEVLAQHQHDGTVVVFGTPAEEIGVGKVFMARDGLFEDLDVVLNWHPSDVTIASYGTTLALNSVRFRFRGIAAHAAAAPERGISALDAVEVTNFSVNMLREHVAEEVRIHYVVSDGGDAPNVVPDFAEVWYFIRAPRRDEVEEVYARVIDCARAGALATGAELEVLLESALYEVNPNEALARILDRHLNAIGPPRLSAEDRGLARSLRESLGLSGPESVEESIRPPAGGWAFKASTDVGDVSWIVPTTILKVATWPRGCPAHTWQAVASGGTGVGQAGMMVAAEVMAAAALELFTDPQAITRVRSEFRRRTEGFTFRSGMPGEVDPPVVQPPPGYPSGPLQAR